MSHNLKKTAAVLMTGLLLGGLPFATLAVSPTAASAGNPVYSALQGNYSEAAVNRLVELGVLDATSVRYFNPDATITRTEFDTWLKGTVGTTSTAQSRGELIPRWEAAMLVDKARVGVLGGNEDADAQAFLDHGLITPQARAAVGRLYTRGVLVGEGDGFYRPDWKLTRGEAAVMLNALLDLKRGISIEYSVVQDESKLPADVQEAIQQTKNVPGVHNLPVQNSRYVLVSAGEGTSLQVHDVIKTVGAYFVKVSRAKGAGKSYAVIQLKPETGKFFLIEDAKQTPNLKLGQGESITLRKDAVDLNHDGQAQETVAIIGSHKSASEPTLYDKGYLGFFDSKGNLKSRNDLSADDINAPLQILVTDVSVDGKNDVVIESDLHGNGGEGAHNVRAYVQQGNGTYAEAPLQTLDWSRQFSSVTFDKTAKAWTVKSTDGRTWTVALTGPQWKDFDPSIFPQPYLVNVDPPFAVSVDNGKLSTRQYSWTGSSPAVLFYLVPTYKYVNGKFVIDRYHVEQAPGTILQKK